MFQKLWRRFRDDHARHEQQKDEAAIDEALREREQAHKDPDLSDAEKRPPIFKNTDWTSGGPL